MSQAGRSQEKDISFRPVTAADDGLLFSLYASTRAAELAQVPWSEEQKQAFVRMQFDAQTREYAARNPQATHEIICVGEKPAGRLYLSRKEDAFHILDIIVMPEHRGSGIGTWVVKKVMADAAREGKAVTIYVESFNPSMQFFERLGFQPVRTEGIYSLLKFG
jgi:ribosomal protein S18 acetylase RimI-like enzyme